MTKSPLLGQFFSEFEQHSLLSLDDKRDKESWQWKTKAVLASIRSRQKCGSKPDVLKVDGVFYFTPYCRKPFCGEKKTYSACLLTPFLHSLDRCCHDVAATSLSLSISHSLTLMHSPFKGSFLILQQVKNT